MKTSNFMLVTLLFLSIVTISFPQIKTLKAEETKIHIRADGTVDGTNMIHHKGNVYTLIGGILGKQVIIEKSNIIIDGNGMLLGNYDGFAGVITLHDVRNVTIRNCIIKNCVYGIELNSSSHINIFGNQISEADSPMYWPAAAIHILTETSNINIIGNDITHNKWGVLVDDSPNLVIHHNNFLENYKEDVPIMHGFSATWDDGKEGNYWNKYDAADKDGNGIGDKPHIIEENHQDNHPLMTPIVFFDAGTWGQENYKIKVVSNSTVSDFSFYPEGSKIQFDVEGERWTSGFCRVTIPRELLSAETEWTVLLDNSSVTPSIDQNENNTYLYFNYPFQSYYSHSTKTVEVIGTTAIPEFPSWAHLLIILVAGATIAVYKHKINKQKGRIV